MVTRDDGATWEPLKLNLPTVAVHDLVVKDDDLVVGTHGRSIWILDDLTPIREMSPEVRAKAVHLFPAPVTTAWRYRGSFHEDGPGENPPANRTPGTAVLPFLSFSNTLRVHVELTQSLAGGVSVIRIQYLFFHECYGELGRMVSVVDEPAEIFTNAAEFRRLAL